MNAHTTTQRTTWLLLPSRGQAHSLARADFHYYLAPMHTAGSPAAQMCHPRCKCTARKRCIGRFPRKSSHNTSRDFVSRHQNSRPRKQRNTRHPRGSRELHCRTHSEFQHLGSPLEDSQHAPARGNARVEYKVPICDASREPFGLNALDHVRVHVIGSDMSTCLQSCLQCLGQVELNRR